MKHSNVSIFIPHNGCPHMCSFCNQNKITGQVYQPTPLDVEQTLEKAASDLDERTKNAEIAFFGGSFTAIDRTYMLSLLDATKKFRDKFCGIRISTRPDYIDNEILDILKSYGVTSIELGAQSMSDDVLLANDRGHSAESVFKSSELIKSYGFSLGLQMMTGLYKSDIQKDLYTAETFVKINPDTVRIYPTVIMKDTKLAELYLNGEYTPYSLEKSVNLCSKLIELFEKNNIKIIRLGLHYSDSLVNNSYGDNYHPAFKELCENKLFYDKFIEKAKDFPDLNGIKTVVINSKSLSKFLGQKRSNVKKLNELGYNFSVCFDDTLQKYELYLK
ncbi:radical SAM protein [Ruminococcus sp. AF43-11]|nr:radical SAM protein [Ruminococcus sp. AF43-11]RGF37720.1 radical SAM protein [Ruminococcus sp. AF43-11]